MRRPNGPCFLLRPRTNKILFRPQPAGNITGARASYDSVQGRIVSEWRKLGRKLTLHVEIPVNCTATVYVPRLDTDRVFEGGHEAASAPGARWLREEPHQSIFQVGSGVYDFSDGQAGM